jgi:inner membrane protein
MPTAFTHAAVGLALSEVLRAPSQTPLFCGLSMALAAAPDLDILAFPLGIPYGSFFGHRGFFHSLFCALLTGLVVALLSSPAFALPWWQLWGYFFLVTASHGILDGFTNGGLGIAFFSPFDTRRYFFPWQPIEVSPIGMAFFSRWGLRVLRSELLWVWLPLACIVGTVRFIDF